MKLSESQEKLLDEITETYGEWLEMSYPLNALLLSLLEKEREKNNYLEKRIEFMQNTARSNVART